VAALAGIWTNNGVFDSTTRPTMPQVESFIDNISGIVNTLLAEAGFSIPISQVDAVLMLRQFVEEAVADLCAYANGAGRFYAERVVERGTSTTQIITRDFAAWIDDHAVGLENLGASRTTAKLGAIGYRESDEAGSDVEPLFTRGGFGGSNKGLGRE
jgi:hypothetical protein